MDKEKKLVAGAGRGQHSVTKDRAGPGRPTRKQAKQRDLDLLDKALDLFLENGFERTSIDGITASVGMAKRTVYLRYGNKMGLFKASLQRAIEDWIVPVDRLRAAETDHLEETLLRIGQILIANIMSPAGLRLLRITNAESGRLPDIGAFTYKQGTQPTLEYLADVFRRRIKSQGVDVPDLGEAAMAFLELVVGGPASMVAWGVVLDKAAIDKHTRYSVRLFLHGLLHSDEGMARSPIEVSRRGGGKQAPHEQKNKHDVVSLQDLQKLEVLEDENRRLKMLLAESMLEVSALKSRL